MPGARNCRILAVSTSHLLREGDEIGVRDVVSSLQRSGGGEGPARSAGSLVLDVGHGAGVNPVDRSSATGVVVSGGVIVPPPVDGERGGSRLGVFVATNESKYGVRVCCEIDR